MSTEFGAGVQEQRPSPEVREALDELHRYLSDQLPPMMVTGSIELLLGLPPEVMASGIKAWVAVQYRSVGTQATAADYFFHALRKLHLIGEFKLVSKEQLASFIQAVCPIVLSFCPAEDREALKAHLVHLGDSSEASAATSVDVLLRPVGGVAAGGAGVRGVADGGVGNVFSREAAQGLKRFALLLERVAQMPQMAGGTAPLAAGKPDEALSQILATAAMNSRTKGDLDQYLARLRELGMDARTDQIFMALGRSLPGWVVPAPAGAPGAPGAPGTEAAEPAAPPPENSPVAAMHRLVSQASDPAEGARRFSEMMKAAIERFNEGALVPAVTMFELAEKIIDEKKVDGQVVKNIRLTAHESLSTDRLVAFADKPDKHLLLRKVLNFFPALGPSGLFDALQGEPKRERRHLFLSLLEAHGSEARIQAFRLMTSGGEAYNDPFFQRNLIYLLRRIPRPAGAPLEEELDALAAFSGRDHAPIVIKEALTVLSQVRHHKAEQTLIQRLREFEEILLKPGETLFSIDDLRTFLDRIAAGLARFGTSASLRALIDHGLKRQPQLGDTSLRLADLATQDLSSETEAVGRLVKALRAELPLKVFGFTVQKKNEIVPNLIKALSGTPSREVHEVLDEIVRKFPGEEFAVAASKTLSALGSSSAKPTEPATTTLLSGDLELFGLPNVMQTLSDSQTSGTLTLADPQGQPIATMILEGGRVVGAQTGILSGEDAFYQLFERPSPGTFYLRKGRGGNPAAPAAGAGGQEEAAQGLEILPLLLEAMRRHDEFRRACALVPDETAFAPTGTKPTRPEDEADRDLLRAVWAQVAAGASPALCETKVTADSFRIRRLYAHWFEEGALKPS